MSAPVVSIIVPHHLDENKVYLDRALAGIKNQSIPTETLVISSAKTPIHEATVHDPSLDNATKKVAHALTLVDPDSKYILFHSDDVVLSRGALDHMVASVGDNRVIVGPVSNSDHGSRFFADFRVKREGHNDLVLVPDMSEADTRGYEAEILEMKAPVQGLFLLPQPWICFFCVLIPKSVFSKVGYLDEKLDSRSNDVDYCMRAAQVGVQSFIDLGAFAFHYGSRTLRKSCKPGEQDQATKHFQEKWSK